MEVNWVLQFLFVISFPCFLHAVDTDYPSANLGTSWINNGFNPRGSSHFVDGSIVRPVLLKNSFTSNFPAIGCGFYGNQIVGYFFFVIFAVQATNNSTLITAKSPVILWTANRANPVKENATLQLTSDGDLVLRDAHGISVWSSSTSINKVVQMNITANGTLLLVNSKDSIQWSSWDNPTDTLVPNQVMGPQNKLIASVSASNWDPGSFYLSIVDEDLFAFIDFDSPQMYCKIFNEDSESKEFKTGRLHIFRPTDYPNLYVNNVQYVSNAEKFQYMRLDPDGYLRVFQWDQGVEVETADILTGSLGDCGYPTVCGNYGICSNGNCSCPIGKDGDASYFRQLNSSHECVEVTQLSCEDSHLHHFLQLDGVSYFDITTDIVDTDVETCQQACLKTCSCKAALFQYKMNFSTGNCSLPSEIFSLKSSPQGVDPFRSSSFIKVQKPLVAPTALTAPTPPTPDPSVAPTALTAPTLTALAATTRTAPTAPTPTVTKSATATATAHANLTIPTAPTPTAPTAPTPDPSVAPSSESSKKKPSLIALILGLLAALALTFLIIWTCVQVIRKQKCLVVEGRENNEEDWENSLDMLSNLPTRFAYKGLEAATKNFREKLGGGGFGSVFEGNLANGTKIAVKRLDHLGQGRKEFLAEVKTTGSIHHVNLVRLMGFCAEKGHRLLVYEHMSNGSLDKWIFHKTPETALGWEIRKKIILHIAKGLAYLHEDCHMKIAHLDVKPQNILLDDSFNAKLSDFGLARLIDKNQSQVTTQMRGTRGYMAPEWLSRKITEKVDVYSFGVVMLEIVCGRKNLDFSQPEENDHLLLHMVKKKAEENRLFDLVDKCSEDMQQHGEEAVKMIMVAIWCLHFDFTRRPSMSMVVKVLEGAMVMEPISDYSFLTSTMVEAPAEAVMVASNPQLASILSGPR